jgi:hypothetical protein
MRASGWTQLLLLSILLTAIQSGCSSESSDSTGTDTAWSVVEDESPSPSELTAAGSITAENVVEHENSWPDIVALVAPWTPSGAEKPLKIGYRGALVRVEEDRRVRIAFGRHGNHVIPIELTDLIARANEVQAGNRHKIAPNFLGHFGTQFLDPTSEELGPFPTPELSKSTRFLCVFARPSELTFPTLAGWLAPLRDVQGLQTLFFPLDMPRDAAEGVKVALGEVDWQVPFAYPQAAELHAQKLLGEVPARPMALLITDEGRLLLEVPVERGEVVEQLRAAVALP